MSYNLTYTGVHREGANLDPGTRTPVRSSIGHASAQMEVGYSCSYRGEATKMKNLQRCSMYRCRDGNGLSRYLTHLDRVSYQAPHAPLPSD